MSIMKCPVRSQILRPLQLYWCNGVRWSSVAHLFNERLTIELKHKIEEKYRSLVNGTNQTYTTEQEKDPQQTYTSGDKKENFYVLSMFPYPSGSLHMGHVRVYTISDTLARFYALKGKKVFQPMGWDAFGLPAENAAIENNVDPQAWTLSNIGTMKDQLNSFGAKFDWGAELATCDPRYYKWTQALFLDLYHAGLVYRKEALVNWDPVDNTVLADEQVDENGISWRSGAQVEKRCLSQWFVRTTRLAKDLYEGLSDPLLQDWKDIINLQQHWIGEPNGVTFEFQVLPLEKGSKDGDKHVNAKTINVWIPRDEIENVTKSRGQFLAVKSTHMLATNGTTSSDIIGNIRNSLTGSSIPIVVSDDLEYPSWRDVRLCSSLASPEEKDVAKYTGILESIDTETSKDKSVEDWTRDQICSFALENGIGGYPVSSKLRDWLISRQRYWGTPIPIIHCPSCGTVPVPYSQLPVTLPPSPPTPLASNPAWQEVSCPKCGHGEARRETDTMDTFVDSSWYYVRYLDKNNKEEAVNTSEAKQWLPVDLYIGGKEHAVLHLYYARFIAHFLYAQGKTPSREPFKRMLVQGMIMGQTHKEASTGKYLKPDEVYTKGGSKKPGDVGTVHSCLTHEPVTISWEKMSKSKYNGVNPASLIQEYGVDTTRLFVLSDVAPTSEKHWSDSAFPGILNWQVKLWLLFHDYLKFRRNPDLVRQPLSPAQIEEAEKKLTEARNKAVRNVSFAYDRNQQLNAAICRLQSYTTSLRTVSSSVMVSSTLYPNYLQELLIMLAPMIPHLSSFLWDVAEFSGPRLWERAWPQVDQHYPLTFRVMIYKKPILDVQMPKSELLKLDKSSAISLLVEQIQTNKKMKFSQYLLEDNGLCDSNQEIHFSIDPNNDAILTLPFSMKYTKPAENASECESSNTSDENNSDGRETSDKKSEKPASVAQS